MKSYLVMVEEGRLRVSGLGKVGNHEAHGGLKCKTELKIFFLCYLKTWSSLVDRMRWRLVSDQLSNKFRYCNPTTVTVELTFHKHNSLPTWLDTPFHILPLKSSSVHQFTFYYRGTFNLNAFYLFKKQVTLEHWELSPVWFHPGWCSQVGAGKRKRGRTCRRADRGRDRSTRDFRPFWRRLPGTVKINLSRTNVNRSSGSNINLFRSRCHEQSLE